MVVHSDLLSSFMEFCVFKIKSSLKKNNYVSGFMDGCDVEIEKSCEQKHQTVNESAHQILPPVGQHIYGPITNDITLPCPPVHWQIFWQKLRSDRNTHTHAELSSPHPVRHERCEVNLILSLFKSTVYVLELFVKERLPIDFVLHRYTRSSTSASFSVFLYLHNIHHWACIYHSAVPFPAISK